MRGSQTGKTVFARIEADHGAKLRAFKRMFSLHPLADLQGVTLYGDGKPKQAVALINGMGGTTMMELLTIYREVALILDARNIPHLSPMIGPFSTTQEMAGFSISLLTPTPDMLALWQAPHAAPLFPVIQTERGGP